MAKTEEAALRRLVGKRVRAERIWQERSQDQLADAAGVTRNFVSAIERGVQGLDAYRLGRLADALGLTCSTRKAARLEPDRSRWLVHVARPTAAPDPGSTRQPTPARCSPTSKEFRDRYP
jgi:transcriptional regulator with XRE-family HTH domain